MATYTPVTEWLALPVSELHEWVEIVAAELKAQRPKR